MWKTVLNASLKKFCNARWRPGTRQGSPSDHPPARLDLQCHLLLTIAVGGSPGPGEGLGYHLECHKIKHHSYFNSPFNCSQSSVSGKILTIVVSCDLFPIMCLLPFHTHEYFTSLSTLSLPPFTFGALRGFFLLLEQIMWQQEYSMKLRIKYVFLSKYKLCQNIMSKFVLVFKIQIKSNNNIIPSFIDIYGL